MTNNLIGDETVKPPNNLNHTNTTATPTTITNNNNDATNKNNDNTMQYQKRYSCSNCPYSTDRRDLFTRHENIHKEDKPFHCYVCLKQFNRADHVKKHFLRMHRSLTYDIARTRRSIPQVCIRQRNSSSGFIL